MADKKERVVAEQEFKEVETENQQNTEGKAADTKPAEDKKEKKGVPKWLKTTGRVIEGVAATFGAVVGTLLVFDKATSKRRARKYEAWQQNQRSTYTPVEPTTESTFQKEFHNEESQI